MNRNNLKKTEKWQFFVEIKGILKKKKKKAHSPPIFFMFLKNNIFFKTAFLIDSLLRWDGGHLLGVQGISNDSPVLQVDLPRASVLNPAQSVLHPILIVSILKNV